MKYPVLVLLCIFCFLSMSSCLAQKKKVTFESEGAQLAGTIYFPKGDGPFPAVVFVHGSGEETRRNSIYSAKWMASIGYAAFVYDKRGTGKSDGEDSDWQRYNFQVLANDVHAAVQYLKSRPEVDQAKIGLHAASQGGWVAPLAASMSNDISFMVIKSASVTTVLEDNIFERAARLRKAGFSEADLEEVKALQRVEAKFTPQDDLPDEFTELFEKNKDKAWFSSVYSGSSPYAPWLVSYRKWYATVANHDPIPYLEQIDIPILWIFGDPALDHLGPVKQSLTHLKTLKKDYKILSFEGEGHNVVEGKYRRELFEWLVTVNGG